MNFKGVSIEKESLQCLMQDNENLIETVVLSQILESIFRIQAKVRCKLVQKENFLRSEKIYMKNSNQNSKNCKWRILHFLVQFYAQKHKFLCFEYNYTRNLSLS